PAPCSCTHHTPLTGADKAPLLSSTVIDRTGPGAARPADHLNGTARHGTARHGTARHGTARHGTCW
ncbi:hypothetical protein, partial [Streptomyces avermitilis]|uniref:hypothetical protein n=1 Tax=Streptomyces avermitilis TaxID=33903 RepID=UPI003721CB17